MSTYQTEFDAYAAETETTPTDLVIARARWEAAQLERQQPFWSPLKLAFAGGLAVAAAAMLIQLMPSTPNNRIDPQGPVALGEQAAVDIALPEGISISGQGEGVLSGTEGDRKVALTAGTMHFQVTPNAGLHLEISTSEATATVLGTVFDVTRDALGTTVSVERGEVQVDCAGGDPVYVTADMSQTCYSAQGYLENGRALQDAGESPDAVLAAIKTYGAVHATDAQHAELEALRISSLSSLKRYDDVLSGAEAFLADAALVGAAAEYAPAEMRRFAARAAMQVGHCERALPWLAALRDSGEAQSVDLVQYATCMVKTDPTAARTALEDALELELDPKLEALILKQLGR